MKLIVGLGNPGKEYENTRHNVGFIVVNYFPGNKNWQSKFDALCSEQTINNEKVLFIKPITYMNLSGLAVKKFVDFYKLSSDDVLIIQDDMDLPVGKFRLKYKSSCGGHNGMRSIINELNTDAIPRLKVGIAHDRQIDTKDYVLGKLGEKEMTEIKANLSEYQQIIIDFISYGIDYCMMHHNK